MPFGKMESGILPLLKWKLRPMSKLTHNCLAYHNLLSTYPALAKEWHPVRNGKLTPGTLLRVLARKSSGYAIKAMNGRLLLIIEAAGLVAHTVLVRQQVEATILTSN